MSRLTAGDSSSIARSSPATSASRRCPGPRSRTGSRPPPVPPAMAAARQSTCVARPVDLDGHAPRRRGDAGHRARSWRGRGCRHRRPRGHRARRVAHRPPATPAARWLRFLGTTDRRDGARPRWRRWRSGHAPGRRAPWQRPRASAPARSMRAPPGAERSRGSSGGPGARARSADRPSIAHQGGCPPLRCARAPSSLVTARPAGGRDRWHAGCGTDRDVSREGGGSPRRSCHAGREAGRRSPSVTAGQRRCGPRSSAGSGGGRARTAAARAVRDGARTR
jgi:hypothetical protein